MPPPKKPPTKKKAQQTDADGSVSSSAPSVVSQASRLSSTIHDGTAKVATAVKTTTKKVIKKLRVALSKASSQAPDVLHISDSSDHGNAGPHTPKPEDKAEIDELHGGWTSAIYTFFETNITIGYNSGR
ncbi:hypothetical protein BT96DRAFT_1001904 [Gymnopus androsaceus JB14]|uniref:Uncharacterized protein n=1 Tax=Gymnopus androsaceus JB14 TaxID=1447944 RepID=A0A6A4H0B2_9AGAR|nr:hypothetical protein BT96DRAFT_1001904 [Gymnopus androsaceus JB14]